MPDQGETEKLPLRDQRLPGWFWIENEVIDQKGPLIGAFGFAVYSYLVRHSYGSESEFTVKECADALNLSASTVIRVIDTLIQERLISKIGNRGLGKPNIYIILTLKTKAYSRGESQNVNPGESPETKPKAISPETKLIRNKTNKTKSKEPASPEAQAQEADSLEEIAKKQLQKQIVDHIDAVYLREAGLKCPWSNTKVFRDLKNMIPRVKWEFTRWQKAVENRFSSEGINPAEDPTFWIQKLPNYAAGPLNKFGGRLESMNGKGNKQSRIQTNRDAAAEAGRSFIEQDLAEQRRTESECRETNYDTGIIDDDQ